MSKTETEAFCVIYVLQGKRNGHETTRSIKTVENEKRKSHSPPKSHATPTQGNNFENIKCDSQITNLTKTVNWKVLSLHFVHFCSHPLHEGDFYLDFRVDGDKIKEHFVVQFFLS